MMSLIKEKGNSSFVRPNMVPQHADVNFIRPKILYFFAFLQQYCFYSFRSVFFKNYYKFNDFQFGCISAFSAGASFLGMTVWSNAADRTKSPKMVFLILVFGSLVSLLSFSLSAIKGRYYPSLVISCIYSFFNFGMNPILSNTVLEMLVEAGEVDKSVYGRQVLFGTFAYVVSNLCLGIAMDEYGQESLFTIYPIVSLMLFFAVLYAFPSDARHRAALAVAASRTEKSDEVEKKTSDAPDLPWWHVLKSPRFVLFLLVIFFTGCARTVMSSFLSLYCKEKLGITGFYSSLVMISGVVFEVGSFVMAPTVSRLGPYWMLVLAQIIMAVRAWAYVYIPASGEYFAVFLFIELLKGAAFGLTHLAGVRIAKESAPPGLEATAQGFYEGFYAQIPAIISAPMGGATIQYLGFKSLFFYTAVGISICCASVISIFAQNGKLRLKK